MLDVPLSPARLCAHFVVVLRIASMGFYQTDETVLYYQSGSVSFSVRLRVTKILSESGSANNIMISKLGLFALNIF